MTAMPTTIVPAPDRHPTPTPRSGGALASSLIGPGCPTLTQALASARDKCKAASKDGHNAFHNYDYSTADEVVATGSEALNGSGLALIPLKQKMGVMGSGNMAFYALDRVILLSHSSGEYVPLEVEGWPVIPDKGKPLDKALAIALTSSLAYLLRDLLQMPRGDQHDMSARDDRGTIPPAPSSPPPVEDVLGKSLDISTPEDHRAAALATKETARQERYGGTDPNAPAPAGGTPLPAAVITPEQRAILVGVAQQKGRTSAEVSTMLESRGLRTLDQLPQSLMPWALGVLTDGQATTDQLDRISKTANARKIPWEAMSKRLQEKFGVDRLRLLTRPQADQIEKALASPPAAAPVPA